MHIIIILEITCKIQIHALILQSKQYVYIHENKNRHPSRHNRTRLHHYVFLSEVRPKDTEHHSELHQRQSYNKTFGRLCEKLDCDITDLFYPIGDSDDDKENVLFSNKENEEKKENTQGDAQTTVNTTAFCPHCGAKDRVGVVLLPEE